MSDLVIPRNLPNANPIDKVEQTQKSQQNDEQKKTDQDKRNKKRHKQQKAPEQDQDRVFISSPTAVTKARKQGKKGPKKLGKGDIIDIQV
ncbi:MAG: hypothetical protein ACE5HO_00845 [bacterium]